MPDIAVQQVPLSTAGLQVATVAAGAGGDSFQNDGRTFFQVTNGGGAGITVTFDSPRLCDQGAAHDLALSVPAGQTRLVGPFGTNRFNDAENNVQVSYSAVTSVTVAAIRL